MMKIMINNTNGLDLERKAIWHEANFIGFVSLGLTALLKVSLTLLLLILSIFGIVDLRDTQTYGLGSTGFLIAYAIAYSVGMGLPAPVIAAITRRRIHPFSRLDRNVNEDVRIRFPSIVLILLAGLAMCIVANFATSYIVALFRTFNIFPPEIPTYMNKTVSSLFINVVIFAALPAILEEMVYRGYILRVLYPYGDSFAIVISSLLFALMHGNILQIPFTFLVGLTCGYLTVRTGRIWPAMMLHFLNNFMASLLQYASLYINSDTQSQKMTLIVFAIIGLVGLFALLILFAMNHPIVRWRKRRLQGLKTSQKAAALFTSPAMIISLLVSLVLTIMTTHWGGAA